MLKIGMVRSKIKYALTFYSMFLDTKECIGTCNNLRYVQEKVY